MFSALESLVNNTWRCGLVSPLRQNMAARFTQVRDKHERSQRSEKQSFVN
jgi:hypothetical protein